MLYQFFYEAVLHKCRCTEVDGIVYKGVSVSHIVVLDKNAGGVA